MNRLIQNFPLKIPFGYSPKIILDSVQEYNDFALNGESDNIYDFSQSGVEIASVYGNEPGDMFTPIGLRFNSDYQERFDIGGADLSIIEPKLSTFSILLKIKFVSFPGSLSYFMSVVTLGSGYAFEIDANGDFAFRTMANNVYADGVITANLQLDTVYNILITLSRQSNILFLYVNGSNIGNESVSHLSTEPIEPYTFSAATRFNIGRNRNPVLSGQSYLNAYLYHYAMFFNSFNTSERQYLMNL